MATGLRCVYGFVVPWLAYGRYGTNPRQIGSLTAGLRATTTTSALRATAASSALRSVAATGGLRS